MRRVAAKVPGGEELFLTIDTAADGSVHQGGVGAFKANGHKIRVGGSVGAKAAEGNVGDCSVELLTASGAWKCVTFEKTIEVSNLQDAFLLSIPALDCQIDWSWAEKVMTLGELELKIETRRNQNGTKKFGLVARQPTGPSTMSIAPDDDAVIRVRANHSCDAADQRAARAERRRRRRETAEKAPEPPPPQAPTPPPTPPTRSSREATDDQPDEAHGADSQDCPATKRLSGTRELGGNIARRVAGRRRPLPTGKRCRLVHRAVGHASTSMAQRLLMRSDLLAKKLGRPPLRADATTCGTCDAAKMACKNRSGRSAAIVQSRPW